MDNEITEELASTFLMSARNVKNHLGDHGRIVSYGFAIAYEADPNKRVDITLEFTEFLKEMYVRT